MLSYKLYDDVITRAEQAEHLNNLMRNNVDATGEHTYVFELNACIFLRKTML